MENSKKQGNVGLGEAITYFLTKGHIISLPLNDSQDYDLVVDIEDKLQRVQVKTVYYKNEGKYAVNLRVCGGNKSGNIIKHFDKSKIEFLFVLTDDGQKYCIPARVIEGKSTITLHKKYAQYKI